MHYAAIDECSLVSTTGGGSPAQTVEENGAAEPAQDVVTEETRHGVGHQAIRVE